MARVGSAEMRAAAKEAAAASSRDESGSESDGEKKREKTAEKDGKQHTGLTSDEDSDAPAEKKESQSLRQKIILHIPKFILYKVIRYAL